MDGYAVIYDPVQNDKKVALGSLVESLSKQIREIEGEAEEIFKEASKYRERITTLKIALANICKHPKDYVKYWQEQSGFENWHSYSKCTICGTDNPKSN